MHGPVKSVLGLAHLRHHRMDQVRLLGVHGHFDALGVHQEQTHLFRLRTVQQAEQDTIEADALARTGGTGHQQVRHPGQVRHKGTTGDVLAQDHGQGPATLAEIFRRGQLSEIDDLPVIIGDLDTHGIRSGDRGLDAHGDGLEGQGQIVADIGDTVDADTGSRAHLVHGDHRPGRDADELALDVEILQAFHQRLAAGFQILTTHTGGILGGQAQQIETGQRNGRARTLFLRGRRRRPGSRCCRSGRSGLGGCGGVLLCRSRFGRGGRGSILPAAFLRQSLFHGNVTGGGVILSSRDDGRRLYDDRTGSRRRKKVIIVIRPGDGHGNRRLLPDGSGRRSRLGDLLGLHRIDFRHGVLGRTDIAQLVAQGPPEIGSLARRLLFQTGEDTLMERQGGKLLTVSDDLGLVLFFLFFLQDALADAGHAQRPYGDPGEVEGQLDADQKNEEPDQPRAPGAQIIAGIGVQGAADHPATGDIAKGQIPCGPHDQQADGEQKKAAPAPPADGIRGGDTGRAQGSEDQRPDIGAYAKNIIEEAGSIGTQKSRLVADFSLPADHMVEAGVIGAESHHTEQHQQ